MKKNFNVNSVKLTSTEKGTKAYIHVWTCSLVLAACFPASHFAPTILPTVDRMKVSMINT